MENTLRHRLERDASIVLDAAMGTELSRRGANTAPPLWSARALVEAPELVEKVHRENVAAGADILTIASFRLHARNLREDSCSLSQGELIAKAVDIARRAAAEVSSKVNRGVAPPERFELAQMHQAASESSSKMNGEAALRDVPKQEQRTARPSNGPTHPSKKIFSSVWIAGSLAPLEDCYRPDLVPSEAEISSEHSEMAAALAAQGVDLILVETMNSIRELVAATAAAVSTGLPVLASMVTDGEGRLLSGESIEDAADALLSLSPLPDALGINCVPARKLGADLARLSSASSGIPLLAYGNTGRALDESRGIFTEPIDPYEYAALARGWLAEGARIVGGCCGTNAAHVRALRSLFGERNSERPPTDR
ncbi:MAG TPA: homocysteine S-methyltransferase family protein [Thermoanaerobaculia bacterium]|nr:homocysteine S-methyltransferase family protein [Thermoanaerobaculia bacterium]